MTDEPKKLPNLWRWQDATLNYYHSENELPKGRQGTLYIPAERIKELIEDCSNSEQDFPDSYFDLLSALESFISEDGQ